MSEALSRYQQERRAREAASERAHQREFFHDLSDEAKPVSMNIGITPGQYSKVVLHAKGEHATTGAVHVALTEDNVLVVAIEVEPGMNIIQRVTKKRPRWRFYDFWVFDRLKHNNVMRHEIEWPKLEEVDDDR